MKTYLAEECPSVRLVVDERPPLATKIWMIGAAGVGFAGHWHPEITAVGWSPLPKLTPAQKARLRQLVADGVDVTQPQIR